MPTSPSDFIVMCVANELAPVLEPKNKSAKLVPVTVEPINPTPPLPEEGSVPNSIVA